jgi:hypothetical protein
MNDPFEESRKRDGAHHRLAQLTGDWAGTTKTWFEPGVLADESEWRGVIRPLLDGRFVMHEYEGSLLGEPLCGYCLFGYDLGKQKYQSSSVQEPSIEASSASMACSTCWTHASLNASSRLAAA